MSIPKNDLKTDLIETFQFLYGEVAAIPHPLPMEDAEAWYEEIIKVLRRHPEELAKAAYDEGALWMFNIVAPGRPRKGA